MPDTKQLPALIRLYDDESEAVRSSVLDTLATFGDDLETALNGLSAELDPCLITAVLEAVAEHVEPPEPATAGLETVGNAQEPSKPPRDRPAGRRLVRYEEGQLVRHRRYGYRGVVVAHDRDCRASDKWYEANRTRPERHQPWYHVLVDGASHVTYAAQSSLLPDESLGAVEHPLVPFFFRDFDEGRYLRNGRAWPTPES